MNPKQEKTVTAPPRLPRMAEVVAAQLRQRIIAGDLEDGDELPREAVLLEEFGVSRPSLREAIRILETEGLIRIRRGKVGGAIVSRPTAASAAYHFGLTLQSNRTTLDDLAAARTVMEPACAALAASLPKGKRSKLVKQLSRLIDANEAEIGETTKFTASALEFHRTIVEMSGNTTITVLAGALEAVWSSQERLWAEKASSEGEYPNPKYQREVVRAHRRILKLIQDGDVDGAQFAMRTHLTKSQPYVNYDDVPIEVVRTDR
jgi:DNA-binding FadR family transcriptional regulator